eukprot:11863992-Ditylum_brightwellii.AAC.1
MKNVGIVFQLLEEDENTPIGSKWIPCHMVFDVKFDLTWKVRWVVGGHRNDPPKHLTYSTVVSRESVWLGFLIAALNNLDVLCADIGNVYINAKPREWVRTTVGEEFGVKNAGRIAIIVRAIYRLKMKDKLKYVLAKADPDVYIRPEVASDGSKCYSYILICVDDVLVMSHCAQKCMDMIAGEYRLKGKLEAPKMYLGMDIRRWKLQGSDKETWAFGANSYVKEAIRVVEQQMKEDGVQFIGKGKQPFSTQSHQPEEDTTKFCDDDQMHYYQNLVGVMRWMVEIGR